MNSSITKSRNLRFLSFILFIVLAFGGSAQQLNTSFCNTNGDVRAMAYDQANNRIYIGGNFTSVCGTTRVRLAAIDATTGSLVTGFNITGINGDISCLAVDGNKLYLTGFFTSVQGQPRSYAACINTVSNTVSSWTPNPDWTTLAVLPYKDKVYLGGMFSHCGSATRNLMAEVDSVTGAATTWDPSATGGRIEAFYAENDTLYAVGAYNFIAGDAKTNAAAIDLTTNTVIATFAPEPDQEVYAVLPDGANVYLGGDFANLGGGTTSAKYLAKVAKSDGSKIAAFDPNPDGSVYALTKAGNRLFAGGGFSNIGGSTLKSLAAVDKTTGASSSFNAQITGSYINALAANSTSVFLGGYSITNVLGTSRKGFAALCYNEISTPASYSSVIVNPCGGGSYTLSCPAVSGATFYTWSYSGTGASFSGNTNPVTVTFAGSGLTSGTFSVKATNGCETSFALNSAAVNPYYLNITTGPSATSITCGQSVTYSNNTNYTGSGSLSYSWTPSTGLSSSTALSPVATPTSTTTYSISASSSEGCSTGILSSISVNSFSISATSAYNIVCGDTISIATSNTYPGAGPLSYSWLPLTGLTTTNAASTSALPRSTITYTLSAADAAGCSATKTVTVNVAALSVSLPSTTPVYCGGNVLLSSTSNYTGQGAVYNWLPANGLNSTSVPAPVASPTGNTTYSVTLSLPSTGCSAATASTNVTISNPDSLDICLVTVDSATGNHNIIVWSKPASTVTDSFYIYREITTNNFQKVGAVAYDSLSEFHDYSANPNATGYRYKITVLDTCGLESSKSLWHNTIHLQYLGSGNLQWSAYDIEMLGTPVVSYNIYRDDNSTGTFNLIGSTPAAQTTFTDVNFSSYPNASYRTDVTWGVSCTPTRGAINTSRSNIKTNSVSGIAEKSEINPRIYPNPFNDALTLDLDKAANSCTLEITNTLGQVIHVTQVTAGKPVISTETWSAGVYFYKLYNSNGMKSGKIVKE